MHGWTRLLHDDNWRLNSLVNDRLRTEKRGEGLHASLKAIAFVLLPRHTHMSSPAMRCACINGDVGTST